MVFVSPPAANTMLMDYHAKEIIGRKELIIAALPLVDRFRYNPRSDNPG